MKMKGAKQVHYDSGPNMTPLVDVVMVILIFLMLAGKFGKEEHFLSENVPIRKNGGGPPTNVVPDDVELTVTVDGAGDRFNATVTGVNEPVQDQEKLEKILSQEFATYLNDGKTPDHIQVMISPGRTVKYKYLTQVYEAVLQAHVGDGAGAKYFTKVAFNTSH